MKQNTITTGGNIPLPGQRQPSTIILTQNRRFGIDIGSYMSSVSAIENIDFPQRSKYYDLCDDILMDTHLSSVINKRKSAILCSPIEFRRNGKPDEAINTQLRSPWFLRFLGDALDAIPQGNTLVQFFRDRKTGWVNYILIPRKHYDPVRRLILKRQHDITGVSWDEFEDLLFIGEPRSLGELAKAAPWVIYKRNSTADWSQFAEIFGMPMRKYTYDPEDEEALEQLKENDENQGSAASWFLPDGCNMELVDSGSKTGSSELYKTLVDTCNNEISKLFLGNTLTTEAGNKGSQALGTVHGKVEERISQSDRKFILNLLNYDMADIFLRLGINTSSGEFCYSEPKMTDLTTKMNLFTQASSLGLEISKKQMYDDLGLERPENEEDAVKRPQSPSFPPQIGQEEEGEDDDEKKAGKKQESSKGKETVPAQKKGGLKNWWRSFFANAPEAENHGAPLEW